MAWRYRDNETKRFVSVSTWTRSKAHGGTRYVRESDKTYAKATQKARGERLPSKTPSKPTIKLPSPEAVKTVEDWNRMLAEYNGEFDEGEAGTGVDYGEEK